MAHTVRSFRTLLPALAPLLLGAITIFPGCLVIELSLGDVGPIITLGYLRLTNEEADEEPVRGVFTR